jgi:hypothetical protein
MGPRLPPAIPSSIPSLWLKLHTGYSTAFNSQDWIKNQGETRDTRGPPQNRHACRKNTTQNADAAPCFSVDSLVTAKN